MRLDRKLARLAASALATAMFVCGAALPASANEIGVATGKTFAITSNLLVPENIASPQVDFKYTISEGQASANEVWPASDTSNKGQVAVYDGEPGGLIFTNPDKDGDQSITDESKVNTVTYNTAAPATPSENEKFYTVHKTLTLEAQLTTSTNIFKHAGVYKYTLKAEKVGANTHNNFTVDTTERTIYVYVGNGTAEGELEIKAITMVNGTAKNDEFNHKYLFEDDTPDPENQSANLILSKTVSGDYGNKQQEFSFTVVVTHNDEAANTKYAYVKGTINAKGAFEEPQNPNYALLPSNGEIKLKHNEAIKIVGLTKGDKYTISETVDSKYETTAAVTGDEIPSQNNCYDANKTKYTVKNTDGLTESAIQSTNDITVAYTNTHKAVTPTGVIMNVAPYVLMVIIAVAGAFVFLRKRRDD